MQCPGDLARTALPRPLVLPRAGCNVVGLDRIGPEMESCGYARVSFLLGRYLSGVLDGNAPALQDAPTNRYDSEWQSSPARSSAHACAYLRTRAIAGGDLSLVPSARATPTAWIHSCPVLFSGRGGLERVDSAAPSQRAVSSEATSTAWVPLFPRGWRRHAPRPPAYPGAIGQRSYGAAGVSFNCRELPAGPVLLGRSITAHSSTDRF